MSESHKGQKRSKESIRKTGEAHKKPIQQIDLKTKMIINTFDSVLGAEKHLKSGHGNVSACARGETRHAYGYGWCYIKKLKK